MMPRQMTQPLLGRETLERETPLNASLPAAASVRNMSIPPLATSNSAAADRDKNCVIS